MLFVPPFAFWVAQALNSIATSRPFGTPDSHVDRPGFVAVTAALSRASLTNSQKKGAGVSARTLRSHCVLVQWQRDAIKRAVVNRGLPS